MSDRLDVRKTYKLFIGGAFPRSESGRVYAVTDGRNRTLANAPRASRKDARDAVTAARRAFGPWSSATAFNRGQILYRVAEMLEDRREQFAAEVAAAEGLTRPRALAVVDAAVDRWVWYAGWTDKFAQVAGAANPVAGPYANWSAPVPAGVVAIVAPRRSSLLGLVSVLAPVITTGNTAVVLASERAPLPALSLAEVLAVSDLPGGVVNILSGTLGDVAPALAAHRDVDALDLTGVPADAGVASARDLELAAAETVKRVLRPPAREPDWTADPGLRRLSAFTEIRTVWHSTGT